MQESALAQVAANRAGFLRSNDPEYLHQLRVGLRRLRSALRAFRQVIPKCEARRSAREARRLMRRLGAARDWDVFLQWLESQRAPREVLLVAQRERARARARAKKTASRVALQIVVAKASAAPLERFAEAAVEPLERKALGQARRMDWGDARERHALRVRVKRLRYAGEFFGRRRPELERLQTLLGELNDVEVARRLLRKLSIRRQSLDQALEARERRLLRALERMKTSSMGQASGRRG